LSLGTDGATRDRDMTGAVGWPTLGAMSENTSEQATRMWVKGGPSPNPGGRPKVLHEVRALAREHTARAIERLADMLDHPDGRVVVAAASTLLDRGWGKPEQAVIADVQVAAVDVDALRASLAARLDALAAAQGVEAPPALPDAPAAAQTVEAESLPDAASADARRDEGLEAK
jgi:hypothetical protein